MDNQSLGPIPEESKPLAHRLLSFFEQPLFWGPVGIVGGLVGLFFYTPILFVCGICILLAFLRAGVVSGRSWKKQLVAYLAVTLITAAGLYCLQVLIKKHAPDLGKDISEAVVKKLKTETPDHISPSGKNSEESKKEQPKTETPTKAKKEPALNPVKESAPPPINSVVRNEGSTEIGHIHDVEVTSPVNGSATIVDTKSGGKTKIPEIDHARVGASSPLTNSDNKSAMFHETNSVGTAYINDVACGPSALIQADGANQIEGIAHSKVNDQKACNWMAFLFYAENHRTDIADFMQATETRMEKAWSNLQPEERENNRTQFKDLKRQLIQESRTEERFELLVNQLRNGEPVLDITEFPN